MKKLIFFLLILSISVNANECFYDSTYGNLTVTPCISYSLFQHEQVFKVSAKHSGDLCIAYKFNYPLFQKDIFLQKTELRNKTIFIYCFNETNISYINNVTNLTEWKLINVSYICNKTTEYYNYSYWDSIKQYFNLYQHDYNYYYYSTIPLYFNQYETKSWKIKYKPNNLDNTFKWDAIIWNSKSGNCKNDFISGNYNFKYILDPWWNSSFLRKKPIEINSLSDLTDYQIPINVTYDSDMKINFDDLRFTNEEENLSLDYWIEDKINSSWAYIWVEVDSIDTNNGTQAYMYYGNSGATSESNGTNTFLFFDDFLGNSLDTNKWGTVGTPSITISNSVLEYDNDATPEYIKSNPFNTSYNVAIRTYARDYTASIYPGVFGFGVVAGTTDQNYIRKGEYTGDQYYLHSNDGSGGEGGGGSGIMTDNVYHIWSLTWLSGNISLVKDENLEQSLTTNIPSVNLFITIGRTTTSASSSNSQGDFNWILVRKYTHPEPTYSIGSEETSNNPPNNPNPSISPSTIYTYNNANCTATYSDYEGDIGNLTFEWYVDSVLKRNITYSGLSNNTVQSDILDSNNYSQYEVINCTVIATDNNSQTNQNYTTKTVQNNAPYIGFPYLVPYTLYTNTDVQAKGFFRDNDGDNGTICINITNNVDVYLNQCWDVINNTHKYKTLQDLYIKKNRNISCLIWGWDMYNVSFISNFTNWTIVSNIIPNITTDLTSINLLVNETWYYDYNATDLDVNDSIDTLIWSDNTTLFNINSSNGIINFSGNDTIGNYSINISVSDSDNIDYDLFILTISSTTTTTTTTTTIITTTTTLFNISTYDTEFDISQEGNTFIEALNEKMDGLNSIMLPLNLVMLLVYFATILRGAI